MFTSHVEIVLKVSLVIKLFLTFFENFIVLLKSWSFQASRWCLWTHWPTLSSLSTTPRNAANDRFSSDPRQKSSPVSWPSWWSTATSASSRSSTTTEAVRSSSTWPDVSTSVASSRPGSTLESPTLKSGPTISFHLVNSGNFNTFTTHRS